MTGVERPRRRRFASVVAVLLPIIVLAGASAWFVRAYVMPPTITIEPLAMSSAEATPANGRPLKTAVAAETTGIVTAAGGPESAVRYTTDSAAIWAAVPLPGPFRQVQGLTAQPAVAASEPSAGAVPLPPSRPQLSGVATSSAVPLPRPRPSLASN